MHPIPLNVCVLVCAAGQRGGAAAGQHAALACLCSVRRTCILSRSAASYILHRPALDDLFQVARSKASGEAMALEEEAERENGHRKRSTLDHQLARRVWRGDVWHSTARRRSRRRIARRRIPQYGKKTIAETYNEATNGTAR